MDQVVGGNPDRVWVVPAPEPPAGLRKDFVRMGLGEQDRRELMKWAAGFVQKLGLQSDVSITSPSADVMHVHHRLGDRDILLFSNMSRTQSADITGTYTWTDKIAWKWDPETGGRARFQAGPSAGILTLHLEPAESLLLVFEPGGRGGRGRVQKPSCPCNKHEKAIVLQPVSGWRAEFQHAIADKSFSRELTQLADLSRAGNDAPLATFAGRIVYRTQFDNRVGGQMLLDLGQVFDVSEVRLNGKPLGVRWWGRHVYPTAGALRRGRNELEIQVTTMLGNYCKSLQAENPVAKRWAFWFPPIPAGLVGPVRLVEE